MRRSKFTEEQMVRIVRETDNASVVEVAKEHRISNQKLYVSKRDAADAPDWCSES